MKTQRNGERTFEVWLSPSERITVAADYVAGTTYGETVFALRANDDEDFDGLVLGRFSNILGWRDITVEP